MTQKERTRKNMNLSKPVFSKLDKLRKQQERVAGYKVSWDRFFSDLMVEVGRCRSSKNPVN